MKMTMNFLRVQVILTITLFWHSGNISIKQVLYSVYHHVKIIIVNLAERSRIKVDYIIR